MVLLRGLVYSRAYIYCSEWVGVIMPGFEKIYRQCL
jgi:hypothetical protein